MGEHSEENNPPVTVQCYAGYKGTQRPQKFSLAKQWLDVTEILKEWREPDAVFFRVRADDGKLYVLCHRREGVTDEWTLESVSG